MVGLAATGLVALLAFDVWALQPFIRLEFRRLEPWKIALVCVGDLLALLWLLWYIAQHFVLAQPLRDRPLTPARRRSIGWFYTTLALGLGLDLAATLILGYHEVREYDRAVRTTAEVTSMRTRHASHGLNWEMICQFRDGGGRDYQTIIRLHLTPGDPFPTTLSPQTIGQLEAARPPHALPIRYAASWPARAWLDGVPEDSNGLTWFSIAVIGFQAMGMSVVAALGWRSYQAARSRGATPWWLDIQRAIPAGMQILVMAYWGALMKNFG